MTARHDLHPARRGGRPPPAAAAGFVPWSLPLAAGMLAGVAAAAMRPGEVGAILVAATGACLVAAAFAAGSVARRADARSLRRCPLRLPSGVRPATVALVGAGLLLGGARWAAWEAVPDALAGWVGRAGTFHGRFDGAYLHLDEASGARVAVAGGVALPVGRVAVRGRLERPSARRNPGGFDYAAYLRRRGVRGQLFVDALLDSAPHPSAIERLRLGATAGLPPRSAAVLEAMTLGVRADLGDLRDTFAAAGLSHVLALSGLHVGVLVAALGRALAPLGRRRYPLLILATVGYVALVGPSASVVRAGCMVVAGLLSLGLGYERVAPWPSLALAAVVGLLAAPAQLMDASFQLSYLAVAGMLVFAPPLMRRLGERPWWHPRTLVVAASAVSVSAQLPSLSLVASSFGRVPLFAPLVNIVAVPLAGLLVPLGFASALVGLASPTLAGWVNHIVGPLAGALLDIAALGARLPALPWGEVRWVGHACFALAAIAGALALHGRLRPWRALTVILAALLTSALIGPQERPPEVVFLDVGQGDATLVRLGHGVDVLVDGGGTPFSDRDVGAGVVLPALRALGVWDLDAVVATHPDLDHVEGLLTVLRDLRVGMLVMGPPAPERAIDVSLRRVAEERGVPVHRAVRGERWRVGEGPGAAVFDVLNPTWTPAATTNDNSVALLLRVGGAPQVLMLGDASAAVERELAVPRLPVLKVAHHGSRFSTSDALLRATRPQLAVISVGRNGYKHPSPDVLQRLHEAGVTIASTWGSGALRLPLSPRGPGPLVGTVDGPDVDPDPGAGAADSSDAGPPASR